MSDREEGQEGGGIRINRLRGSERDRRRSRVSKQLKDYTLTNAEGRKRVRQLTPDEAERMEKLGFEVEEGRAGAQENVDPDYDGTTSAGVKQATRVPNKARGAASTKADEE